MEVYNFPVMAEPEDIPDLTAVIAQWYKDKASSKGAPSVEIDETIEVPYSGTWARQGLSALRDRCYRHHRAILTGIATASLEGDGATVDEVLEAARPALDDPSAPYGTNNLRADLAWISKYSKAVNGTVWPVTKYTQRRGNVYRMPKQIAEWWLDIVADAA